MRARARAPRRTAPPAIRVRYCSVTKSSLEPIDAPVLGFLREFRSPLADGRNGPGGEPPSLDCDTSAMGMSLFRLAAIDLWRRRAMPAVMVVALGTATSLAVALPLMQAAAAEQGLRSALRSLGPGGNLEIGLDHVDSAGTFGAFQADAARRVDAELGSIMIPGARFARSNQVQGISLNGVELVREVGDPLPVAVYYEDLMRHVTVTSG